MLRKSNTNIPSSSDTQQKTEISAEIERKFLVDRDRIPFSPKLYPHVKITQGYISEDPVVRIRSIASDDGAVYVLTVKSNGFLRREEHELPLTYSSFEHLREKIDGRFIEKDRYRIPLDGGFTAELDLFTGELYPLAYVEVEFPTEEIALSFTPPDWFGKEVTYEASYTNSALALRGADTPAPGTHA